MSITKTLDTLAQEWYGEFGFSTCTSEEQDVIVNYVFKQQQEQKSKNKQL